ncbi:MAG: RNA-processing protein [Candidatus Diapherotrites archaeon]|nr:RNA-processing protein [Candidatus Diapherotrites archaeon]
MDYEEIVLVPQERLGALIGEQGKTKKLIEERTGLNLEIDSKTGEVRIKRTDENASMALKAVDVVKAIALGFPLGDALELLSDDIYLREVELRDLVRNDKDLLRQRARLIGTKGKARHMLEEYTGTHISIQGKTVAIIGDAMAVELAAESVAKIATGTPHGDVYKDIQKKQGGWI